MRLILISNLFPEYFRKRPFLTSVAVLVAILPYNPAAVSLPADVPGDENSVNHSAALSGSETIWLTNNQVKVGLKRTSGGAISWISPVEAQSSLINSFDRGRLIQQSWYGRPDGSDWNGKPWRWNPVQGGDWRGKPATILSEKVDEDVCVIHSRPVHWATGEELADCVMEQTIALRGSLIQIDYVFHYSGEVTHPPCHQELPAVFVTADYHTLVHYVGDAPWSGGPLKRHKPGWPNEYYAMTEHWAAYVNDQDFGIGCYVPETSELTCYRFGRQPSDPSSCSYFAPIRTIAVTPGFRFQYRVWIALGTSEEIRSQFQKLAVSQ